jgi:hypothetical protein
VPVANFKRLWKMREWFILAISYPPVGYISAITEDFFTHCLEQQQGFQPVVLIQTALHGV